MSTARARLGRLKRAARQWWDEHDTPALGWLQGANRRFFKSLPAGTQPWDDLWPRRHRLVKQLAPGKSFLDLGGMYGITGEIAFLAEQAGASRVVLFDGMDPSDEFDEKHRASSSSIQYVQGDLHDGEHIAALGEFDVVWCAGVIYHSPNPFLQLLHLRRLTREHLLLGTHVVPEIPGIEQACIFYPGVSKDAQEIYARVHGGPERFPGMAVPFDTTELLAYVNMWWGITPSALRSMMRYAGFDVVDEHLYSPFWTDLLCTPGGESLDIYPTLGLAHERIRQRFAGVPDDQLPPWARLQLTESGGYTLRPWLPSSSE